jgi:hypothetical protein
MMMMVTGYMSPSGNGDFMQAMVQAQMDDIVTICGLSPFNTYWVLQVRALHFWMVISLVLYRSAGPGSGRALGQGSRGGPSLLGRHDTAGCYHDVGGV